MTAYTSFDNMSRIAALESEMRKQQAAINQLITINEEMTATLSKMAAVLEKTSAGSDDGL